MSEKIMSKQEVILKRVYEFYEKNQSSGKKFTKDHFAAENIPERTVYRIIQRAENEFGHKKLLGSGRVLWLV